MHYGAMASRFHRPRGDAAWAPTTRRTRSSIPASAGLLHDPLGDRYIMEKIFRLMGAIAGKNRSERPEDREKADGLRDIVTALLAMREEWRHANCP